MYDRHNLRICGIAIVFLLLASAWVTATPPGMINYQGRLLNIEGDPLDTTITLTFNIYELPSGGLSIWTEQMVDVAVEKGLFAVILGSGSPVSAELFDGSERYLGITVGTDGEISPRTRLVSGPYALMSAFADSSDISATVPDGAIGEVQLEDGAVTSNKIALSAVVGSHIDSDAITSDHIADGAVQSGDIADGDVQSQDIAVGAIDSDRLADDVVDSSKIADGSVALSDIASSSAELGDVIKWNGMEWEFTNDDIGIVSGWHDLGFMVTLQTDADSVGIGTQVPTAKLDVDGTARVAGSAQFEESVLIGNSPGTAPALSIVQSGEEPAIAVDSAGGARAGASLVVYKDARVGIGTEPTEALQVDGVIYSESGGIRFPDGSLQTSAATDEPAWDRTGSHVVLTHLSDSVGIGTGSPSVKLDIAGNLNVAGNATIGSSNSASGANSVVFGESNSASGNESSILGGDGNTAQKLNSLICGGSSNSVDGVAASVVCGSENAATDQWAIVGGGNQNVASRIGSSVLGGVSDTASGMYSTVAGGVGNAASGSRSAVSGGWKNKASGSQSAIGGGLDNVADGVYSFVAGGRNNHAMADYSFAAGQNAIASHISSMVFCANFALSDTDTISSGTTEQMVFRADNGIYMSNTSGGAPYVAGRFINTSTGAYLTTSGTWTNLSDKNAKENFAAVDAADLLDRIRKLNVMQWNYRTDDPGIRHIGPTAQDFNRVFELGGDEAGLSTVDPAGIALVAIQELARKTDEIDSLKTEINELRKLVDQLIERESREDN